MLVCRVEAGGNRRVIDDLLKADMLEVLRANDQLKRERKLGKVFLVRLLASSVTSCLPLLSQCRLQRATMHRLHLCNNSQVLDASMYCYCDHLVAARGAPVVIVMHNLSNHTVTAYLLCQKQQVEATTNFILAQWSSKGRRADFLALTL